jgi:dTDP-3-amino-3,4,6-trideoxy-alpha-D-glucose transaminase
MTDKTIQLADFRVAWERNRSGYLEAVERVGQSGWLILGREVEAFEQALAAFWGMKHSIGVANGLDALEISFRCLGAKPGDRFLTTPLSAFATTLAILRVGGVPEFVDVDDSGLIDLKLVKARLADRTRPVRFLVPVHLFGHALPIAELESLKSDFGIEVVEDCAQAIGATSAGRPVGAASRCCATSFYPTKNLGAFGDAGAILTNDEALRDQARCLRDYGQSEKYVHTSLGLNSRLDELHAAILRSVQLPALAAQTERRGAIARGYRETIKNMKLKLPAVPPLSGSVWHLFPVLVSGDRERFREHLKDRGVASGVHYPRLISAQPALRDAGQPLAPAGTVPCADSFADTEVSLPLHPYLTEHDCARVVDACNTWKG